MHLQQFVCFVDLASASAAALGSVASLAFIRTHNDAAGLDRCSFSLAPLLFPYPFSRNRVQFGR
jgi:hypothetical protein